MGVGASAANGSNVRAREEMGSPGRERTKKHAVDTNEEADNKESMLQQILDKMNALDKMNSTVTELSENSKQQWEMFKETMPKLDGVRKDLEKA